MYKVAVLLAAFNGERWLKEQLNSILAQQGVNVSIYISDDQSTDGTRELIESCYAEVVSLLPLVPRTGSAAGNFFRLLRDVDLAHYDAIAFADQDDIWHPDKLEMAMRVMEDKGADAFSSNVEAFWPDGRRSLGVKNHPQRIWDHYFEAAGAGCTYVLEHSLALQIQQFLRSHNDQVSGIELHDWFIYCFARTHDYVWHIDERSSLLYRQHADNVVGLNTGLKAGLNRLQRIRSGWYRHQARLIGAACGRDHMPPHAWLETFSFGDRVRLAMNVRKMRRHWRDRLVLLLALVALRM